MLVINNGMNMPNLSFIVASSGETNSVAASPVTSSLWWRRLWRLLGLCCLLASQPLLAADILVIESYHHQHPWDISYRQALQQQLGANHTLHFFYLDTKRLPETEFAAQAEKVWYAYLALSPALVILGDDNAINLLARRIAANHTPVVYLGMNGNPRRSGFYGLQNLTGVLERPLMKRNVHEMGQLVPNARRALILFDASEVSQTAINEEFRGLESQQVGSLTIDIKLIHSDELWKQEVSQAKSNGYDLLFIGLYHTISDRFGQYQSADQVLTWTGEHTPIPLFSFWDFSMGPKLACGGLVISGRQQGETAAKLAQEILAGGAKSAVQPRIAPRGEYLFSHAALARWGIQLPDDIARRTEWRP